jgi:MFS family permease
MAPLIERLLNTTSLASMFQTLTLIAVIVFLMTLAPLITVKTPLPKRQDVAPIDITQFKLLYVIFLLSLISGLMIIGLTYRVGVVNYQIDPRSVTIGLTIFAILNALSRPFFGWIIDKKSIFFAGSISLIFMAISGIIAFINRGEVEFVFHLTYGFFWFGLGNWVAIAPLAIKKLFGTHNYGKWFGVLFTAYGIAAIIGTLFGGFILDTYNGTYPIYVLIVGLNVVNLFLLMNLKKRYHATLVG